MPWDPGIGTERSARNFTGLFRRWGTRGNVRSILNFVIPVTAIDRYRGDNEGSLWGLYAEGGGSTQNKHPAIVMGSPDRNVDLEVLGFQCWYRWRATAPAAGTILNHALTLMSPIVPYTPITLLDPAGTWIPGLITNDAFTRSNSYAIGGVNTALPSYAGWNGYQLSNAARVQDNVVDSWHSFADQAGSFAMPRPIRIPNGGSLCWLAPNPNLAHRLQLAVSVLYRERIDYG